MIQGCGGSSSWLTKVWEGECDEMSVCALVGFKGLLVLRQCSSAGRVLVQGLPSALRAGGTVHSASDDTISHVWTIGDPCGTGTGR